MTIIFTFVKIALEFLQMSKKGLKMEAMQKIDEKKIIKYGSIAHTLPIPKVFITDNKINTGDELEIFRTKFEGRDALVVFAKLPVSSLSNGNQTS